MGLKVSWNPLRFSLTSNVMGFSWISVPFCNKFRHNISLGWKNYLVLSSMIHIDLYVLYVIRNYLKHFDLYYIVWFCMNTKTPVMTRLFESKLSYSIALRLVLLTYSRNAYIIVRCTAGKQHASRTNGNYSLTTQMKEQTYNMVIGNIKWVWINHSVSLTERWRSLLYCCCYFISNSCKPILNYFYWNYVFITNNIESMMTHIWYIWRMNIISIKYIIYLLYLTVQYAGNFNLQKVV